MNKTEKKLWQFQKGHKFLGDLSKPNYFQRGRQSLRKGVILSDETKRKISLATKGKKKPSVSKKLRGRRQPIEWIKKRLESRKGYRHSEETKRKIGLANSKTIWKTDESKIWRRRVEYRLWREAVFARDNWTCQKTGERGGKIVPHHIQNFSQYPELRFAIDNGITLGVRAHIEFHRKYGKNNNTREQLSEFLKSIECP